MKKNSRGKPTRVPKDTVLIVCEGSKTEPHYLLSFIRDKRISSARMHIIGSDRIGGSAPISLVDYAIKLNNEKKVGQKGSEYDHIWIVLDCDKHTTLNKAIDKAYKYKFQIALSNPCFEIWIFLHYKYSTKQWENCSQLISEIRKKYILNYRKNTDCYSMLQEKTHIAETNAKKLLSYHLTADCDGNPSTKIHLLLRHLESLHK